MAADQLRKRLNANNSINYTSREKYNAKKKKLGLPQDDLNLRSNISLEWDDNKKSVVSKKEQIGLSGRDMLPFVDAHSPFCSNLADVYPIPWEIFEFQDLVYILSFEVWKTQLSECQRSILTQFLPKGDEPDYVVEKLLAGDNFHFGNPFIKWGASVCSGKFHPDDVLDREQSIKVNKTSYYSELHKYHNNMIKNLQAWKERWTACQDPEEEIVQKIWRSRKKTEHGMQYPESNYCDPGNHEDATPESCSSASSEKACSDDDNPILSGVPGESQRRKGFSDSRVDNSLDVLKDAKLKKGENSHKQIIHCGDNTKYLSYFKVSKEMHQRVKSTLKHTSSTIQPRLIDNVIGDLDAFHVQPLEKFEKEEKRKLHHHWSRLAKRDIRAGFVNWSKRKLDVCHLTKSLCREIEENLKCQEQDEERLYFDTLLQDHVSSQVTDEDIATAIEDEEMKESSNILQGLLHNATGNTEEGDSVPLSNKDQHLKKIGPISSDLQDNGMNLDSHDNDTARGNDLPPAVTEYPGNVNHVHIPVNAGNPHGSAEDVWSAVSVPGNYYRSASLGHEYVSSDELSLSHPKVIEDRPAHVIGLEVDTLGKPSRRELLHGQSDDLCFSSSYVNRDPIEGKNTPREILQRQPEDVTFFTSYPNDDRNELFESFLKSQGGLAYDHEQRMMGLNFQQSDNLIIGTGQFPGHCRDQTDLLHPLDMRHKRINDIYMDQSSGQGSAYSDEGRYSTPKHLPVNNIQEWGIVNTRMLPPSQSHLNSGDLNHNWFPAENRGLASWSSLEGTFGPSRDIGSESHLDESLFSILSECNELRSGAHYDCLGSGGRFMQAGANSLAGGNPCTSNILQQTGNPLNYLSHQQAVVGRKANNLRWMGMPYQPRSR